MNTPHRKACRTIVAPMTICGAPPTDLIHAPAELLARLEDAMPMAAELTNGHRRHVYNRDPVVPAGQLDTFAARGYDVNGDTPPHVTLREVGEVGA